MACEQSLLERMNQRQRQILVHSCIYYSFNSNIVSDHQYDVWGKELAKLIVDYPSTFKQSAYHKDFIGYDGSTGFDLPIKNPEVVAKAIFMINYRPPRPGKQ